MAIKPILFSTPMVQAIMHGNKSVTRRVIKPQPETKFPIINIHDFRNPVFRVNPGADEEYRYIQPPHKPGDILWVRETWCDLPVLPNGSIGIGTYFYYKADGDCRPEGWRGNWKPSIFMPKTASRIFLRVKEVRAEMLQDISNEDAIKEGFEGTPCLHPDGFPCTDCYNSGWLESPMTEFAILWDQLNGKRCDGVYQWDADPWVWVIEFERCEKPENF